MSLGLRISFVIRSVKLCVFPLISMGLGVAALTLLPQGTEVLRTINDNGLMDTKSDDFTLVIAFTVSMALWALSNWYTSRLLLQRRFHASEWEPRGTDGFEDGWRTWFPRLLAPISILPVAATLAAQGQIAVACLEAALAVWLFSFIVLRRPLIDLAKKIARRQADTPPATTLLDRLPEGEELMLWLAGALSLVVFILLASINYSFARWLGGASILLLALAAIGLFASLAFIYWPKQRQWPALTGLVILAALIFGSLRVTANHGIAARRVDADAQTRVVRPTAAEHLVAWDKARAPACAQSDCKNDGLIILVAAEGGASRSAWWSAHVLGVLDDLTQGRFGERVFAASGISGGSLGVATWVALRRDQIDAKVTPAGDKDQNPKVHPKQAVCEGNLADEPQTVKSACFLGRDFVAPVLGYMVGVDLVQRIIPVPVAKWDRSRGLEGTWSQDWQALFGDKAFKCPLLDLYRPRPSSKDVSACGLPGAFRTDIPILLLNTATVDRGRPAVQAPVRISDPEIDDLLDPKLRTAGLTLASAVHNSARFPYVSPGGDIQTTFGEHFDSVVDGGYIENSGALGLAALMRSIKAGLSNDQWMKLRNRLIVVFIANDPSEPVRSAKELCSTSGAIDPHPRKLWGEAVTPAIGLFNARSGRADTSRRALARDLGFCDIHSEAQPQAAGNVNGTGNTKSEREEMPPQMFFISMSAPMVQETNPVMSWYMTPHAREVMWRAVATEPASSELLRLIHRLSPDQDDQSRSGLQAYGAMSAP